MLLRTSLAILSALAGVAQAQVGPYDVSGDVAVHDPTLCKDNNGKYFLFCAFPFIRVLVFSDS
jgi:arabinan endo-1,5-alpha-L-arabinosidase